MRESEKTVKLATYAQIALIVFVCSLIHGIHRLEENVVEFERFYCAYRVLEISETLTGRAFSLVEETQVDPETSKPEHIYWETLELMYLAEEVIENPNLIEFLGAVFSSHRPSENADRFYDLAQKFRLAGGYSFTIQVPPTWGAEHSAVRRGLKSYYIDELGGDDLSLKGFLENWLSSLDGPVVSEDEVPAHSIFHVPISMSDASDTLETYSYIFCSATFVPANEDHIPYEPIRRNQCFVVEDELLGSIGGPFQAIDLENLCYRAALRLGITDSDVGIAYVKVREAFENKTVVVPIAGISVSAPVASMIALIISIWNTALISNALSAYMHSGERGNYWIIKNRSDVREGNLGKEALATERIIAGLVYYVGLLAPMIIWILCMVGWSFLGMPWWLYFSSLILPVVVLPSLLSGCLLLSKEFLRN